MSACFNDILQDKLELDVASVEGVYSGVEPVFVV